MFGSRKVTEDKAAVGIPASAGALNSLVKGTNVEGTLFAESDLRVDGSIKGKLTGKAKVIIGPSGSIEGEVKCVNAVIEGRFKGILHVSELLIIKETAIVEGDVFTGKLNIQTGAVFNVVCKMDNGASKQMTPPIANNVTKS